MSWREALFARRTMGVRLGLEGIRAVDDALGRPCEGLSTIHIVGTNGKGSTAAMAAHLLRAAGRRVGLYTSPHLHRVGERVRIDGEPVPDAVIQAVTDRVIAAEGKAGRQLSFFEVLTLGALLAFEDAGVDALVLEAGLGGRLDATRIRTPSVTLVTPIGMDHQAYLGETLEEIAAEKAAVITAGVPCITVEQAALPILEARAREVVTSIEVVRPIDGAAPLPGAHQRANAALALAGAAVLEPGVAPEQLEGSSWPARLERVGHAGGELIFDVAHNLEGIEAIVEHLASNPPDRVVFACMDDKPRAAMLERLASLAEVTTVALEDNAPVDDGRFWPDIEAELAHGRTVLVCGSHFLVAPVRARVLSIPEQGIDPADLSDPLLRD